MEWIKSILNKPLPPFVKKDFIQNQNTTVTLVDCFANNQGGCTEVCFQ